MYAALLNAHIRLKSAYCFSSSTLQTHSTTDLGLFIGYRFQMQRNCDSHSVFDFSAESGLWLCGCMRPHNPFYVCGGNHSRGRSQAALTCSSISSLSPFSWQISQLALCEAICRYPFPTESMQTLCRHSKRAQRSFGTRTNNNQGMRTQLSSVTVSLK